MVGEQIFRPQAALSALARRPEGAAAMALVGLRVAAVGGFVRDALIGREPRELDLVVEGDPAEVARQLGGEVVRHPQFLACHVSRDGWSIEVTGARTERYPRPGALPLVAPASIEADLVRRDFTVNAIAVTLEGELIAPPGALDDLAAGRLRVLHERSFVDDPTRALRLARYRHRLDFEVDPWSASLAAAADLDTVSGARIATELRLIVLERDPLGPLADLEGKLPIVVDRALVDRALALAPADADRGLLILAGVLRHGAPADWIASLELTARERDVILAASAVERLAAAIEQAHSPSELRDVLSGAEPELVALAGALGPAAGACEWLDELRHVSLEIGGDDLLAAGIPAGPELGARLERTLRRKLDGQLAGGRDAELAYALTELR
jgi:tRNA nucleotidyltransferase (CCA-adding enzyme)